MMSYDDVILHNMLMYTQLEAGNWGKTVIILMYTAVYITCTAKWCTSVQYTAIHWILQYKVIQYAIQGGPGKKIHRAVCSTPKFGENIVSYCIVTTLRMTTDCCVGLRSDRMIRSDPTDSSASGRSDMALERDPIRSDPKPCHPRYPADERLWGEGGVALIK